MDKNQLMQMVLQQMGMQAPARPVPTQKMVPGRTYPGNYPGVNQGMSDPNDPYGLPPQIDPYYSDKMDETPVGMVPEGSGEEMYFAEHPLWPEAEQIFVEKFGRKPASDSDMEVEMQEIIKQLLDSDAGAEQEVPEDAILKQIAPELEEDAKVDARVERAERAYETNKKR